MRGDRTRPHFEWIRRWHSQQRVGTLEETLVDQLATSYWRYRRLLIAESAEIAKAMGSDESTEGDLFRRTLLHKLFNPGQGSLQSAFMYRNSGDLARAISGLGQLGGNILKHGLSWERDRDTLEEVFGTSMTPEEEKAYRLAHPDDCDKSESFIDQYKHACEKSGESEQARASKAERIVQQLEGMVSYLGQVHKAWIEKDEIKRQESRSAALVPKDEAADKFLRYQTTLERSIERTLTQLERLQRMRLGHPVPPPIKVQLAG